MRNVMFWVVKRIRRYIPRHDPGLYGVGAAGGGL